MKSRMWTKAGAAGELLAIAAVTIAAIGNHAAAQEKKVSIADLAWIAGSWQTAPGGRTQVEEHWTAEIGRAHV